MESWSRARGSVAKLAAALDPSRMTVADCVTLLPTLTEIKNIAAAAEACVASRIAESDRWRASGARSAAEEYAKRTGTPIGQARDALAAANAMRESERLRVAAMSGKVSPAQAVVIGDTAEDVPDAVDELLDLVEQDAGHGGAGSLQELKAAAERAKANADPDPEATARRIHDERNLRQWVRAQRGHLHATGSAADSAWITAQLEPIREELRRAARLRGEVPSEAALSYDAMLVLLARGSGVHAPVHEPAAPSRDPKTEDDARTPGQQPGHPVDGRRPHGAAAGPSRSAPPGPAPEGAASRADGAVLLHPPDTESPDDELPPERTPPADGSPPPGGRPRPNPPGRSRQTWSRATVIIRVDAPAAERGRTLPGEVCEMAGAGPVPVSAVEAALQAGARLAVVTTRPDGSVEAVAHVRGDRASTVNIRDPQALQAELIRTGRHVAGLVHAGRTPTAHQITALQWISPTCTARGCTNLNCEVDHETGYALTRDTKLGDLDPLCRYHHRLKTLLGWALVAGHGPRDLVPPTDARHPGNVA